MTTKENVCTAIMMVLAVVIVYRVSHTLMCGRREGFASKRAHQVYQKSQELFDQTQGQASYSAYKTNVENANPVLYTDARNLWKKGKLTPDAVQEVL